MMNDNWRKKGPEVKDGGMQNCCVHSRYAPSTRTHLENNYRIHPQATPPPPPNPCTPRNAQQVTWLVLALVHHPASGLGSESNKALVAVCSNGYNSVQDRNIAHESADKLIDEPEYHSNSCDVKTFYKPGRETSRVYFFL